MRWVALAAVLLAAACGSDADAAATSEAPEPATTSSTPQPVRDDCADVIDATAQLSADGTYTFTVTVRSADTGWDKYADAWEVRSRDGAILGTRVLTHPHETEQPFTRSLDDVVVPEGVDAVIIAARDSVEGFCGEPYELSL